MLLLVSEIVGRLAAIFGRDKIMKEFNINMEGYNINGICVGCLAYGRRMFYLPDIPTYFRLLADVEIPVGVVVQLCWECSASITTLKRFGKQVQESFEVLKEYSKKNPFLVTPSDISKYHISRLTVKECMNIDLSIPFSVRELVGTLVHSPEVKEEDVSIKLPLPEDDLGNDIDAHLEIKLAVKEEHLDTDNRPADMAQDDSVSDDETLSTLSARKRIKKNKKIKKKKAKDERKRNKPASTRSRKKRAVHQLQKKLGTLPPDYVKLLLSMTEDQIIEVGAKHIENHDLQTDSLAQEKPIVKKRLRIRRANPNEKFKCPMCTSEFNTSTHLRVHMRIHTGEKPYECATCQKRFAQQSSLTSHIRTHTGEKPYECSYCHKCFSKSSNLSTHKRTHTGVNPYVCPKCGKKFTQSGDLTLHMRIHTGEKPYACTVCGKTFAQRGNMGIHMRTHTGERPYVCSVCGRSFARSHVLAKHMRTHRKQDSPSSTLPAFSGAAETFFARSALDLVVPSAGWSSHVSLARQGPTT